MPRRIPPDIGSVSFDVIIIGAGINGAGIARDAAMRGLRVLLLDKGDVAGGTSSWSTRLIHGGLRYLEHGELGLVRESLRERERLLRNAPHLVRPLPLFIPIYKSDGHGPWTIRAGMIAYDLLSFDKSLHRHRMLSKQEALDRVPSLNPDGLRGAAVYYDAQVEYAERLVVENALSARNHGALIRTYARVDRLLIEGGAVRGVEFTDLLGGGVHTAAAPVTVNVAGPWVDQVLAGLGNSSPQSAPRVRGVGGLGGRPKRMIGGTKGSHIVVRDFPGAPAQALYVEAQQDHRPYFILPWNDQYLIGTTDVRYEGDLNRVEADEGEIEYLIRETNRVIPEAHLTRESILFTYSGVRPLPYQEDGAEGSITRRHFIHDHAPQVEGFLSIVGGKLTTYRSLSEEAVDRVYRKLCRRSPTCRTGASPLPGGTGDLAEFGDRFRDRSHLTDASNDHLLRVYGTRATQVLALASEGSELKEPLSASTGAIGAEILMSFRHELSRTLADALLRRTMVGVGPKVGLDADEAAARIAQKYLGWDNRRARQEVESYRRYVERFHPRDLDE